MKERQGWQDVPLPMDWPQPPPGREPPPAVPVLTGEETAVYALRKGKAHRPVDLARGDRRGWLDGDSRSVRCGHVCRYVRHVALKDVPTPQRCRICWAAGQR